MHKVLERVLADIIYKERLLKLSSSKFVNLGGPPAYVNTPK
jgi:hypothetical protein